MKLNAIYIEVENFQRDLIWRLKLAEALTRNGMTVYLGRVDQTESFYNRKKFGTLYLLKDIAHTRLSLIKKISLKNMVTALDEESFSCAIMPEKHFHFRVSPEVLEFVDKFYCSFLEELNFLRDRMNKYKNKFVFTGNPRFKLEKNVPASICYKKILVPFSYFFQPIVGKDQRRLQIDTMKKNLHVSLHDNFEARYKQLEANNEKLLKGIIKYSALFPKYQFVLRPHPSCCADFSQYLSDKISLSKNITIDDDIAEADLVLHTNCTSGLDAFVKGVPAINVFGQNIQINNSFINMKKLMGLSIEKLPSHDLEQLGCTVSGDDVSLKKNPMESITKNLSSYFIDYEKYSKKLKPHLISLVKLAFRKDRLLNIVLTLKCCDINLKYIQNQVLLLELK